MSKFQPKIIINNPEKTVPDDIAEQFFLTIKTADVDRIRDFANMYKNKFSLIETGSRSDGNNPFHIVLQLDDKIADNEKKFQIIKYLDMMGAPIDLPNKNNVWPIHLAAEIQSKKIVDFFLKKKVSIDRLDSSNNTPLHYSIVGKQLANCPYTPSSKGLNPPLKLEKMNLNKSLQNINTKLIKLISSNNEINKDLIHLINTIMKIPEMYKGEPFELNLQRDVSTIFSGIASNINFPSEVPSDLTSDITTTTGASSVQNASIEQLIDTTYSTINDGLLRGLTNSMNIVPGNSGWGPTTPNLPNPPIPPNDLQKILPQTTDMIYDEIKNDIDTVKKTVTDIASLKSQTIANSGIKSIDDKINNAFYNLLFCTDCAKTGNTYGEEYTRSKLFYLLVLNEYMRSYPERFAQRVLNELRLMDPARFIQAIDNDSNSDIPIYYVGWSINTPGVLFTTTLHYIIPNSLANTNVVDNALELCSNLYGPGGVLPSTSNMFLRDHLIGLFGNSDNKYVDKSMNPHNELLGVLGRTHLVQTPDDVKRKRGSLFMMPVYEKYLDTYKNLPDRFKGENFTWFHVLNEFLKSFGRDTINNSGANFWDQIFRDNGGVNRMLRDFHWIPATPFPNNTFPIIRADLGNGRSYTYMELFRLFNAISFHLINVNYGINTHPVIFDSNISEWPEVVNDLGDTNVHPALLGGAPTGRIRDIYPEFIFLFHVLVDRVTEHIRSLVVQSVRNVLQSARDDTTTPYPTHVHILKLVNTRIDYCNLYNLILPYTPNIADFTNTTKFIIFKNTKFSDLPEVINAMSMYSERILPNFFNSIVHSYFPLGGIPVAGPDIPEYVDYNDLDIIRNRFEIVYFNQHDNFDAGIDNFVFIQISDQMFTILRNMIRDRADTDTFTLNDQTDPLIVKIRNHELVDIQFATEIYGFYILSFGLTFDNIRQWINVLNKIVRDILLLINNEIHYYIQQVLLPLYVKIVIIINKILQDVHFRTSEYFKKKSIFFKLIKDVNDIRIININNLTDTLYTTIKKDIGSMYSELISDSKYYNNVVDYLNIYDAYSISQSETAAGAGGITATTKEGVFDRALSEIGEIPSELTDSYDYSKFAILLDSYKIPNINYHTGDGEIAKIRQLLRDTFLFFVNDTDVNNAVHDLNYDNYNGTINYTRSGTVSNSPTAGDNLQTNLTIRYNPAGGIHFAVRVPEVSDSIQGNWFDNSIYDKDDPASYNPINLQFAEAFISFKNSRMTFEWLNGMPVPIKRIASPYLRIVKQTIVQSVVQRLVDNKYAAGGAQDADLLKIYEDVRRLGNENSFTNVDDVKVTVVVGKLVDSVINRVIEYSIRSSIGSWILSFATKDNKFNDIVSIVNRKIDIIRKNDYLKIVLNELDADSVEKILQLDSKYVDFNLTQIENDLDDIKYATKPVNNMFIHHLYNINYFSSSNTNTKDRCYKVVPEISKKLIDSFTVNKQNSDGNTPLHIALDMKNSELVEVLISHGAKINDFKNMNGKTPYQFGLDIIEQHVKFTSGIKVYDTISNFAVTFNDLLLARLREDKYNNNVISDITLGIPMQLVIYNHMFSTYLENYRYGFTSEIKNGITKIVEKYNGAKSSIYPIDLLKISTKKDIARIISYEFPETRITEKFKSSVSKKNKKFMRQINTIDIQINGLKDELNSTNDPDKKKTLSELIAELSSDKAVIETKMGSITPKVNVIDESSLDAYTSAYEYATNKLDSSINRNMDIIEFYKYSFSNVGSNKQMFIKIWENYLEKELFYAPSMIFSQLSSVILTFINKSNTGDISSVEKTELDTIINFFQVVKNCIESKNPKGDIYDNPELAAEIDQITYLINLIVTPAARSILLNQIYTGIKDMDGADTIVKNQKTVLDEIINVKYNGRTIDDYLVNVLPLLATKYFSLIYNSSDDPDRKITSSKDLFLPIVETVKSNRFIQITDDSILVQNLFGYTIPFLANCYQYFIHHLRLAVYGYERYILNSYEMVKILSSLI